MRRGQRTLLVTFVVVGSLLSGVASCSSDEASGGGGIDAGLIDTGTKVGLDAGSSGSSGDSGAPNDGGSDAGEGGGATEDAGPMLPPLDVTTTPAAATATVRAYVRDATSHTPLTATATFEAQNFVTAPAGELAFEGATGHHTIKIASAGYVPLVLPIGVTRNAEPFTFLLEKANATSAIGTAGGAVTSNGATVSFPAGAYVQDANDVTATYVTNLLAAPGTSSFSDASGDYEVTGVLHVDVSAQPGKPVEVKVPVPAGITAADARLVLLGADGLWGSPLLPTSVSGGVATYAVTHFTDYGNAVKSQPHLLVRSSAGEVVAGAASPKAGDRFPSGTTFGYGGSSNNPWKITLELVPGGHFLTLSGRGTSKDAKVTISVSQDDWVADEACAEDVCAIKVEYNRTPPPDLPKRWPFRYRSRAVVVGVRGTSFRAVVEPCGGTSKRARAELEVPAGTVDFQVEGSAKLVSGAETEACVGCARPSDIACCWVEGLQNGAVCNLQNPVPFCASGGSRVLCPNDNLYSTKCGDGLGTAGGCGCSCDGPDLFPRNQTCDHGTSCPGSVPACAITPTAATGCTFPQPVKDAIPVPTCRKKEDCPKAFAGCSASTTAGVVVPGTCTMPSN